MTMLLWLLLAAPGLLALAMTVINAVTWPRGHAPADARSATMAPESVAVLIPARDEAAGIEVAVRSALAQGVGEVVVFDDQSTDATPQILATLGREHDRLRVIPGTDLPPDWIGKPHACHRLAAASRGELLLFVDADVELASDGVARILELFERFDADAVTAVPRQMMGTFAERLVLPLLHVTYVSWLPAVLVHRSSDPRFLAANGQILAVKRSAFETAGGFEAVRDAVVDDMAICRRLKETGARVVFADGHDIARCRMYRGARELWSGFSKNIFEGVGSGAGLAIAALLFLATFVFPWAALPASLAFPSLFAPAAAGVAANLAQRLLLAARHRQPPETIPLHPLAVLVLLAIAANSYRWHLRGATVWSGRSYGRKETRRG